MHACMHAVFPATPSFTFVNSHPVVVWTGLNISDDRNFLTVTHKTELKFLQ